MSDHDSSGSNPIPKLPWPFVPRAIGHVQNTLLAALPKDDCERLLALAAVVPLKLKTMLHEQGDVMQYVYFPGGGIVSVVTTLQDGGMVEVATIGREGMAGFEAIFERAPINSAMMVQGESDTCYRLPVDVFRSEMERAGPFRDVMTRYAHALVGVIMQSTACNAVHSVEQRLARWLLMAQDRMAAERFDLTQEFVAMMLGVTRPTVTVVAGTLQKAGLITYRRGHVTIVDREKLESASCECYATSTALIQRVTEQRGQ
jgi:CRP-like cAMP-binding protein